MIYHHWFDIYIYIYIIYNHQPTSTNQAFEHSSTTPKRRRQPRRHCGRGCCGHRGLRGARWRRWPAVQGAGRGLAIQGNRGGCFRILSMEKWWFSMEKWWFSMEKWWFHGKMVVFHGILMVVQWDILSGIMRYWWDTLWLWLTVSYWTWPIWFVDLPKDGDFPLLFVCLPEGNHDFNRLSGKTWHALEKWSYMVMLLSMAGFYIAFHLVKPWKTTWKLSPNWW